MALYPISVQLKRNAARHCATLAITQNVFLDETWPRLAQPDAALRNGTLTFIKTNDLTYAITGQHVVQHYRDVVIASGGPSSHSMRTMLN